MLDSVLLESDHQGQAGPTRHGKRKPGVSGQDSRCQLYKLPFFGVSGTAGTQRPFLGRESSHTVSCQPQAVPLAPGGRRLRVPPGPERGPDCQVQGGRRTAPWTAWPRVSSFSFTQASRALCRWW